MSLFQKSKVFVTTLLRWIFWGALIGAVVGSFTAFLLTSNDFLGEIREKNNWLVYFLPVGGLFIGYLYMNYGKKDGNNSADGNNLIIDAVHGKSRVLKRMGFIVYLGTFITIIFGGSTGREGAAVQMGGSIAQAINQFFKTHILDKKILLMSGISAGFGAAFGTPITAAVFGMEMTSTGKMKYEAIVPCLFSSFIGHYVTVKAWGVEHKEKLVVKDVPELSSLLFLKVIILSIIFSLVAVLYCQLRHEIQKKSEKVFKKNHMKRAFVGGFIIIALTLLVGNQEYNGRGLQMLEQAFVESVPVYAFLAKLIFTAVTLGMGFVGGEAIPLFFIGATLGNTLSDLFHLPLSFIAGLGMIAVFSGASNTPIAAFLLALELFHGEGVEYFFIACIISYIFSGHHGLWPSQTIYAPKSRLYSVVESETIKNIEKNKS